MPRHLLGLALSLVPLCLSGAELPIVLDREHSRIEFEVTATLHSFTGKVTQYKSDILADTATSQITKAQIQIRFADLKTGDSKRDKDMLAWQESDQFPALVFTLISLDPAGADKYTARGQLILHGVTKEISIPVSISATAGRVFSIDGIVSLDTRDFGLPPPRKFGLLKVEPVVRVIFHLQGVTGSTTIQNDVTS